jgi:hypothetical protein
LAEKTSELYNLKKTVHARLPGKKQLAWMERGTQTDFYDVPEFVRAAADRATAWFEETL